MKRSAAFSDDLKMRWHLVRDWRDEIGSPDKTCLFGMLNPSKAGSDEDDPTVRKVVGFGRRWGFGRVVLVNVNPIVSTDPWALPPWSGLFPENSEAISTWAAQADLVVAAWGAVPSAIRRTIALPDLIREFRELIPAKLWCIGTTKNGDPLHPSRAPYTSAPMLLGR